MINREEYNKEIDKKARLSFHKDLESLKSSTILLDFKGKATRQEVCDKLREWKDYVHAIKMNNEEIMKNGLLSKFRQRIAIKRPNLDRNTLRLMLGLMDLMAIDELIPEYIDEFINYETEFYAQFKDIYDYKTREEYPFSEYIDNDNYCK